MSTTISIQQLIDENMEFSLSRDEVTGNVAIVAGDGLDFDMYIFNQAGEVITSDECGFSSHIPYISSDDYLWGFKQNLSLAQLIET